MVVLEGEMEEVKNWIVMKNEELSMRIRLTLTRGYISCCGCVWALCTTFLC